MWGIIAVHLGKRQNLNSAPTPSPHLLPSRSGFFPLGIKRGLFQGGFKVFDCCFLKEEDCRHCHPSLPNQQTLAKQEQTPRRLTAPQSSGTLLQVLMLSSAPSTLVYLYLENGCINSPPPQKKTPIKGECGLQEDSGGEIQLAQGINGRITISRKQTRNKNGFPPPTHPS